MGETPPHHLMCVKVQAKQQCDSLMMTENCCTSLIGDRGLTYLMHSLQSQARSRVGGVGGGVGGVGVFHAE